MANTMTTSVAMTSGQIDRAVEIFRAQLTKYGHQFPSELVQKVFGQADLGPAWFAVLRSRVEALGSLIVRTVKVNRNRSPKEALDATGRRQYIDRAVVDAMPPGEGEEVELVFFKPRPEAYDEDGFITDDNLAKEYEFFGLKRDPMAQVAFNEADPAFADEHPNGCHWKAENGSWHYLAFNRWFDGREVYCSRDGGDWVGSWVFAGVRK